MLNELVGANKKWEVVFLFLSVRILFKQVQFGQNSYEIVSTYNNVATSSESVYEAAAATSRQRSAATQQRTTRSFHRTAQVRLLCRVQLVQGERRDAR